MINHMLLACCVLNFQVIDFITGQPAGVTQYLITLMSYLIQSSYIRRKPTMLTHCANNAGETQTLNNAGVSILLHI